MENLLRGIAYSTNIPESNHNDFVRMVLSKIVQSIEITRILLLSFNKVLKLDLVIILGLILTLILKL